ncbi:MAG: hypothetical protein H6713_30880 [Myxococcales bacterium]|nr:hypothetical protein [Myxococcales bacterium]MCB9754370.1 hypothetical protein [Myxococcales bacterium]
MAGFSPAQLDALEDALEVISGPVAVDELSLRASQDPALAPRLESYRELLELFHVACPSEDPPDGLLDRVMAEATVSAQAPRPRASLWRRLWTQARPVAILPGLALVGTAAAVLLLVRPDAAELEPPARELPASAELDARAQAGEAAPRDQVVDDERDWGADEADGDERVASKDDAEAATEEAEEEAEEAEKAEAPGDGAGIASAAVLKAPDQPAPEPARERAPRAQDDASSRRASAGSARGVNKKHAKSDSAPAPSLDGPRDKQSLRDVLADGDRLRRAGDCEAAREPYNQLVHVGGLEQGRALAGLALCAEARGDLAGAEHFLARARQAYSAIDRWVTTERERGVRGFDK